MSHYMCITHITVANYSSSPLLCPATKTYSAVSLADEPYLPTYKPIPVTEPNARHWRGILSNHRLETAKSSLKSAYLVS